MSEWIKCSEFMPLSGVTVLVYAPPQQGDWPDDVRISFDYIDVDYEGWYYHCENYEHYCCVAKPEGSTGPSEQAPYTHWMPMPAIPST